MSLADRTVETIEYKGHTITIAQDDSAENFDLYMSQQQHTVIPLTGWDTITGRAAAKEMA